MKIGFYQFAPEFGNIDKNLHTITEAIYRSGADLMVFPELAFSGYLFLNREEVGEAADKIPGYITEELAKASAASGTAVAAGIAERSGDLFYNSAVLVSPDGKIDLYRKNHLYNEEKLFFAPGDMGFPVFEVKGVKVGLLVCFDHMFPESARELALKGAQIICHPANLVLPRYAQITSRSRSLENKLFWILADRCGVERRGGRSLSYSGCSMITGPKGEILVSAGKDDVGFFGAEIDPDIALDKKVAPLSDLFRDRRPELYSLITKKRTEK